MRRLYALALALILVCSPALARVELIALDSGEPASAASPQLRILESGEETLLLEWVLPALQTETIEVGGETYQALSLPGGSIEGEPGQAGLPTFSRMLALPAGSVASIRVISRDEETLRNVRVFPVQPDEAESFVIDREAYARSAAFREPVQLGEPALIRGLRVAPLTIHPLRYDPARGELALTGRMELEIRFSAEGGRDSEEGPNFIPESFDRLYRDTVIGYERDENTEVGPGTWLLICDNNSALLDSLQPLLDWRARQGYNVIVQTTNVTGNSETQIKSYIQSVYDDADPPLEYVVLAGDATGSYAIDCWFENLSGYHGEGDHYYSTLSGGDVLSDVHIGRLSFTSMSELGIMVDKIVTYESDPPMEDAGWFTRACLAGDGASYSGITTVYVNQWLKEQLLQHGYTQVDTIWSGNFVSQMTASVNQGVSVLGYRGYYYMSGIGASNILAFSNGYELPFGVVVTCDTGSFYSDTICRSEAFLRAPNGGGIGGVGTATIGTHTRYNNCYYHGVWMGAVNGSDHRLGSAHTRGKIELYTNYQYAQPTRVEIWSMWNNLIGDPATDMWTGHPRELTVTYPGTLPPGANAVPMSVSVDGIPLSDARVALYQDGAVSVTRYTGPTGQINMPLSGTQLGELRVTVLKHNHLPHLGEITISGAGTFAALHDFTVDDDETGDSQGNADGEANPGERLELPVSLRNLGFLPLTDVTATLESEDPFVTVTDSQENFGDIPGGSTAWSVEDFDVDLHVNAPDGHVIGLDLVATDGGRGWTSLVQLTVKSAAFIVDDFNWSEGIPVEPGQEGNLALFLQNVGSRDGVGISGVLSTLSPWAEVTDKDGYWGNVDSGHTGSNGLYPFGLTILPDCLPGYQIPFTLDLIFNDGAEASLSFSLPVGEITLQDPTGPDAYGYYALDDTDDPFLGAPEYDWVELDPNYGGHGIDLNLTDFYFEQDDTKFFTLPFDFNYYGENFDEISICSNGWIAMGQTYLTHYRNWNIPAAGTPRWMIAPFWDNLAQSGSNKVYTWHDATGHRFIIQWSRLKNYYGATQNFELILYDQDWHTTVTGDGIIEFQYHTVHNTDTVNGYATVGIQNGDRSTGLCYSYWNSYAPGAMVLSSERAIRFLPLARIPIPACSVLPEQLTKILAPDETASDWLHISNSGEEGSRLSFELEIRDPELEGRSVEGSTFTIEPNHYLPGDNLDLLVTVHNASGDLDWLDRVTLDMPPGVIVNSGTPLVGSTGSLTHSGTGDGVLVQWYDADGGSGNIEGGDTATATLNVSFIGVETDLNLPWTIRGDGTGGDPHTIYGDFTMIYDGPGVDLIAPDGGELWIVGEEEEILFSGTETSTAVDIAVRRGMMGDWVTLAEDVPTAGGSWPWTVTGPANRDCWFRVSDSVYEEISDESAHSFTIMNPIDWLQLSAYEGEVSQGDVVDIELFFDSAGLAENTYVVEIVVSNNAGEPVLVPVTLIVNETGTAADVTPPATVLAQNHPNPFNPATSISFALSENGPVRLEIFDAAGRSVRVLQDGFLPAGGHHFVWQGRDDAGRSLASGVYFYRLEAAGMEMQKKMVLLK